MALVNERNVGLRMSVIPFYLFVLLVSVHFLAFENIAFPCLNCGVCLLIVQKKKYIYFVIGTFYLLKNRKKK